MKPQTWWTTAFAVLAVACNGKAPQTRPTTPSPAPEVSVAEQTPEPRREAPPPSGEARDLQFPPVQHITLDNGLKIDVVTQEQLPMLSIQLVVQSGSASDPADLPGLAGAVAEMLKEGTKKKPGARFMEAVEFLGASLHTGAGQETSRVSMTALSEHVDEALALLAEVVLTPSFDPRELEKFKKRALDELKLKREQPAWLARQAFQRALYGEHPYGRFDTTEEAVKKLKRPLLTSFHQQHFAPNNAFLVIVGNVTADQVESAAKQLFGKWKSREVSEPQYVALPGRQQREVIVVDRPASVQSQIVLGNLAIKRSSEEYIPLLVANQILGGSAASRLFMDLRERRSLTYGAYSHVDEAVDVGAFRASAAVRTPVTAEAMEAFFTNLQLIVSQPPPAEELAAAQRYLADSFPLRVETPDRVAELLADLRVYNLPDDYWDNFRSNIRKVDAEQALAAARAHIHPESMLVVVVGRAAEIVPALEDYGPVRVIDTEGNVLRRPRQEAPAAASATPAAAK